MLPESWIANSRSSKRDSRLYHFIDNIHQCLAKGVGFVHGRCFAIDADDRLGIAFAQMNPLGRKVEFYAVNIGYLYIGLASVLLFHLLENGINVGCRLKVDAILRNRVRGETCTQLACRASLLCHCA